MHNEGDLILTLTYPPMTTIGRDREPLQARPSLMKRTIGANAEAPILGVSDTMP